LQVSFKPQFLTRRGDFQLNDGQATRHVVRVLFGFGAPLGLLVAFSQIKAGSK
jgi:hypothetical protein